MIVVFPGSLVDSLFLESAGGRHVDFTADDRFDALVQRFAVELNGAEHIAVIRHRHRRLLERFDALKKPVDLVGTVQQTVFGVAMKMNETGMLHGL